MPDISMCKDTSCKERYKCFRYMADPNPYRQSYFASKPPENEDGSCSYHAPIKGKLGVMSRAQMIELEQARKQYGNGI